MHRDSISLRSLVNLEEWQKVQDSFSDTLGITLRTIDINGKQLVKTSGPTQLFNRFPQQSGDCTIFCSERVSKSDIKNKIHTKKLQSFKCPIGLEVFVLPVKVSSNNVVAYVLIGPVILNKRRERSEYAEHAKQNGIDLEEFMGALIELNTFSYNKVRSISTLLKNVFSHIAQTGYHKRRLGEIAPEVIEIDPIFSRYYEEKVLDAFLNACTIALDADSGSVMTLDKRTNELQIKVASKLSQDVIEDTNIKLGEGIAGIAAATAEPIILPKDEEKSGLSSKMKRRHIRSSMILPFSKANEDEVYGVININVVRKQKDFSEKDIAFVKELTNLASIALLPVK